MRPGPATSGRAADRVLFATRADRRLAAVAWMLVLGLSAVLIAAVGYTSRDPDSTVYAGIAARLATEPFARWIAPEWWGHWGFAGPFREHPVGIFLLPALLGRAGYPSVQAAYVVNGLFQAATLVLAAMLTARIAPAGEARALAWLLQLLPIAFVFRIRANQEYAVLAGILLALYATERSRERPAWAVVTAIAFAWTLLVKGVFGMATPIVCAIWLAVRAWGDDRRRLAPWGALAAVLLVAPLLTLAYEAIYARATGDSFLAFYAGPRLNPEAVASGALERVAYNSVWYAGRLAWYAFPWSVFAIAACVVMVRRWRSTSGATAHGAGDAHDRDRPSHATRGALVFAMAASAALIVLFAFSDRKADRFIFPAYYFTAAAGGIVAMRQLPWLADLARRLDRPWVPAAFWLVLFLLRLLSGAHLPRFTFWRS